MGETYPVCQQVASRVYARTRLASSATVAFAAADLINPDTPQAVEQIDLPAGLGSDPLEDLTDRAPRDPHQLGDGALGGIHR